MAGRVQTFKILAHPTQYGAALVLVVSSWDAGRRTDRIVARRDLRVDDQLPLDEPGPLFLALSDVLADWALEY